MLLSVLAFLVGLNVLIFVHELGHLWAAKRSGIPATEFAVGFGPKLWARTWGETEYQFRAIPLGGFVKFEGSDGPVAEYPLADRLKVTVAGVVMNVVLAVAIYAGVGLAGGVVDRSVAVRVAGVDSTLETEAAASFRALPSAAAVVALGGETVEGWDDFRLTLLEAKGGPTFVELSDGATREVLVPKSQEGRMRLARSFEAVAPLLLKETRGVAAAEGLEAGDRLVVVEGEVVHTWSEVADGFAAAGRSVAVEVVRDGRREAAHLELGARARGGEGGRVLEAGLVPGLPRRTPGPVELLTHAGGETLEASTVIYRGVKMLVVGQTSVAQMGGPVAVAEMSHEAREIGWIPFFRLMALLSVNLAVINFLPFPALDGGHAALLLVEKVRGRPVPERLAGVLNKVGLGVLVALMVVITVQDVWRLLV